MTCIFCIHLRLELVSHVTGLMPLLPEFACLTACKINDLDPKFPPDSNRVLTII